MEECYALAIRFEDQQWYKDMMCRIKLRVAIIQIQGICKSIVDSMFPVFKEIAESITEVWQDEVRPKIEDLLNSFQEMADLAVEMEEREEERKIWVSYNPPNENAWYNQYQKKMLRDQRSDMKHFTIYRRE